MSRRHQTYGQYKRARRRRERYAARYKTAEQRRATKAANVWTGIELASQ
jgi:hypothetical protein